MRGRPAWETPVLHADLDAFYPSVEVLKDPALAGRPVIVGGTGSRGVVMSASYEARVSGVQSAMPASRARRLCPEGIFVPPDFEAYLAYSRRVREVFDSFSPVVEPLALDEAFLDLKGAGRMWPAPAVLGEALRCAVREATGLVVSVGIAANKFLAKLGSSRTKPDGMVVVRPGEVESFLHPLPVEDLWGVGEQTAAVLARLGLRTVGDVARVPQETLERVFGIFTVAGAVGFLVSNAFGYRFTIGASGAVFGLLGAIVAFGGKRGGTFGAMVLRQYGYMALLMFVLSYFMPAVNNAAHAGGFAGGLLAGFAVSLAHDADSATVIYGAARALLAAGLASRPTQKTIRLLGVSVSQLSDWPASVQLSLARSPRWAEADRALDRVRQRFGDAALGFGALIEPP